MARAKTLTSQALIRQRIRRYETELAETDIKIMVLKQTRAATEIRLETLRDLLTESPQNGNGKGPAEPTVSDRVVDYIRQNRGLTPGRAVDRLITVVHTSAKDPKKNMHQTILNLKKRGRLALEADGTLIPGPAELFSQV